MDKKTVLYIAAFIVLIIPVLLMLTGCPHIDSLYGLKVTGDGNGGAIAIYGETSSKNIYAQKISPDGELMWGENGVLLDSNESKAYSFTSINVISDGAGGFIVAWPDLSQDQFRPTSHLAKIDTNGKLLWQRDFTYFDQMISDGAGGAIIAFDYSISIITAEESKALTLVRVDAQGYYHWDSQGVTVPCGEYQDNTLQMAPDGSVGVVIVWEESQYPAGAEPGEARSTDSLFAQRINAGGDLLWGDEQGNGLPIYDFPEEIWIDSLQAAEDGFGGIIITWYQVTEDPSAELGHQQTWDIIVQRIDAGGNILWQPGGVPFEITRADPTALPMEPSLTGDGSGGATVIWRDTRHDAEGEASIYAQRIDGHGNLLWQAAGLKYPRLRSIRIRR